MAGEREQLVAEFAAWAARRRGVEPDVIATLLDFKATYLDERPTHWVAGDLSELLFEALPRKVSRTRPPDRL